MVNLYNKHAPETNYFSTYVIDCNICMWNQKTSKIRARRQDTTVS